MTDENDQTLTGEKKKKKEKDVSLPFCTRAPSAEHARATEEDEPCDDTRAGE
jgi:hypothetical protein